jgi:hypothetical protein
MFAGLKLAHENSGITNLIAGQNNKENVVNSQKANVPKRGLASTKEEAFADKIQSKKSKS